MFVPSSSRRPPSGAADGIFIQWGRRQPAKSYTTVSQRGKQSDLREDNPMNLRSAPKLWLAFVLVAAALAAGRERRGASNHRVRGCVLAVGCSHAPRKQKYQR